MLPLLALARASGSIEAMQLQPIATYVARLEGWESATQRDLAEVQLWLANLPVTEDQLKLALRHVGALAPASAQSFVAVAEDVVLATEPTRRGRMAAFRSQLGRIAGSFRA